MAASQRPKKRNGFQLYTTREYFDELIVRLKAARPGERVLLMTMTFDPTEPTIAVLSRELIRAASRGVHVTLSVDAHSFLLSPLHRPGPMLSRKSLPKYMPKYYRNKLKILETINSYPGSHAAIINLPQHGWHLPISGRSHIKIAIIGDRAFVGGCNLQGDSSVDMMISWKSRKNADDLYTTMLRIIQSKHVGQALECTDRGIAVDGKAEFLIDSGARGQSLIFDEAMRLIDSSKEWLVITCQFFPNSITAQHLLQAMRRGVKVEVVFAHPKYHGIIGGFGQRVSILRERTRLPRTLFSHALSRKDPMLHAKLIASDAGCMIGSHNYVTAGVILGTAEIAIKSDDEALAREAVATLHRGLKRTTT